MKRFILILLLFNYVESICQTDSLIINQDSLQKENIIIEAKKEIDKNKYSYKLGYKKVIVPVFLIGLGAIGKKQSFVKKVDRDIRNHIIINKYEKDRTDDYYQYLPLSQVFLLSNLGFKAKHSIKERLVLGITAYTIMAASVNLIKYTTKVLRPDGSASNSFPSGHTATVFTGFEFLRQEYKDDSKWVGVLGCSVAITVGADRIYNNKHWFTDVITGAGIGILSTKLAYHLFPTISRWLKLSSNHKESKMTIIPYPIYSDNIMGVGISLSF